MSMMPGATIGPYRIVEQIGRGGMATVYKAYQPALARYVAIKVLPAFFAEDDTFRERFQQEAIAVARLRHPNILLVFDYGEEAGATYLVSEFIDGGTLAAQVGVPLPLDYTTRILAPIAAALDYAHARGILHRDVKPSNILLAHDGTPVLSDFGLARIVGSLPRLTRTGMTVGTPEYMAPEQGTAERVGESADNYALAVVAYEMLTGRVPFSAETPLAVLLAHLHKPLPLPRSVNPALPEAAEAVLLKGLAKAPEDRYPTASEFVRALAEAAHPPILGVQAAAPDSEVSARSAAAEPSAPSGASGASAAVTGDQGAGASRSEVAATERSRRVQPGWMLVAALLVLALAGGAFALVHNNGGSKQAQGATPTLTTVPSPMGTATVRFIVVQPSASATRAAPPTGTPTTPPQAVASPTAAVVAAITKQPIATSTPVPTPIRGPFSTAVGSWVAGGPLSRLGGYSLMAPLPDGRALAMGGFDPNSGILSNAALYDPARRQWTPTESMHVPRQYFTATVLRNGKVLVAGGASGRDFTASAELYDPARGVWTTTGDLHQPRGEHVAALLPDGTVLVAGGQGPNYEPLISAEIYDPATGTWQGTANTSTIHIAGAATTLADGSVLLAGGDTQVAEVYMPKTRQWRPAGKMSVIRSAFTATLLPSGKALIAGGENPDTSNNTTWATAEVYDPASGTWAPTGSMATPRTGHTAIPLAGGRVLVAGGKNGNSTLASAEVYDPATGRWATAGNMHQARAYGAAATLEDGETLMMGGYADAGIAASYELFRPSSHADAALLQAARPIERVGPDGPARRYFPQTHHQLTGPFLRYWDAHLGAIVLGLPLTEPFRQGGATVQYCERGLLRLAAGEVTLAPLGRELTADRHFAAHRPAVAAAFARYYASHLGPELLGVPLAAPDYETNGDGTGRRYLMQWFERGRLEYHPETPARYRVLPGLVGQQAMRQAERG